MSGGSQREWVWVSPNNAIATLCRDGFAELAVGGGG